MFETRWSVVAVLGFALAGCSHSHRATRGTQEATADAPAGTAEHGGMDARCPMPMKLAGTKVIAEDAPSGEAVTFTTSGDVDELRKRVRAMADMHNTHHGGGAMAGQRASGETGAMAEPGAGAADPHAGMGGMHGGMGGMHGGMDGMSGVPESTASVEDVDGGARVFVTPRDPAQLDDLRAAVRAHVDRMRTAGCGMKSGTGMNEHDVADEPKLGDRL